jgi:flagellar operon protein
MSTLRVSTDLIGIGGIGKAPEPRKQTGGEGAFGSCLQAEISKQTGVTFSAHAQKRLAERNVQFGDGQQARLGAAVDKIQQKGADKSLVLLDDLALVVSARNRVVITAMDSASAKDAVFTNIESAVIG